MDLAESILNEFTALQKKNKELVSIIKKLEHESDVIINQFEEKIADLNKQIKKSEDLTLKSEKKYEILFQETEGERIRLHEEYQSVEQSYQEKIKETESTLFQTKLNLDEKEKALIRVSEENSALLDKFKQESGLLISQISIYEERLKEEKKKSTYDLDLIKTEYENVIKKINDEINKKDKELHVLAGEINNLHKTYEKAEKEWQVKFSRNEQTLIDKEKLIINERLLREQIGKECHIELELKDQELRNQDSIHLGRIEEVERKNKILEKQHQEATELSRAYETENRILNDDYHKRYAEYEKNLNDLLYQIKAKDTILHDKEKQIELLERTCNEITEKERINDEKLSKKIKLLEEKEQEFNNHLDAVITRYEEEKSQLSAQNLDISIERDEISRLKEEREELLFKEIEHLREELNRSKEELKNSLDFHFRETTEKDRQISLMSGNNEAVRLELEKVRSRYIILEKTIREEKEEPVQALFRQIQKLSAKLAETESENSILSARLIRLDTENTRLSRVVSESTESEDEVNNKGIKKKTRRKDPIIPSDVSVHLSRLDDPNYSMESALELSRMGTHIVDTLIPLLYRGSLQRRAWIAAILYEINDPRISGPLNDVMEEPGGHLRELIWDTRMKFREWKRTGSVSTLA